MYTIYLDGQMIYTPGNDGLAVTDPTLSLELNSPGEFTFTMPNSHPYFDSVQKMLSRVEVYRDDDMIFCGRVTGENIDFWKNKTLTCEGELAFLNDSIQRPAEYHNMTVRQYLEALVASHNEQVESDKQFTVGVVTVTDSNDSLYRYTNYNSTMEEIKEDLVDDLGGYLRVRHYNGVRYLDYVTLTDYGNTLDQAIRFGVNLLDFTEDMDVTDLATVVIPLGERLEESPIEALDMRLTIEEVNSGKDYVQSDEGVATYGRLVKVITWDDVTQASTLKSKAEAYLSDTQWDNVQITATAVDMNLTGEYDVPFGLGDYARVVSSPHGLDRYFPISAMTLYLDNPENDTYTMGLSTSASLIGQLLTQTDLSQQLGSLAASTSTNISNVASDVLTEAQNIATILINAATHGYVVVEPDEILIMDTNDKSTAKRIWRWNLNGLGYSSTGYNGTYGTAMTMDGGIVADYITTGTMYADRIKGGTLTLGGSNNTYGSLSILNASGTEVGSWNRNGITATTGYIGNWIIGTNKIYNDLTAYGKTAVMQMPTSSNTWVFAAGGESHSSYSDCPFRVDKSGNMYANTGSIGNWLFSGNKIYNDLSAYGKTIVMQAPSSSNTWAFAVGGTSHSAYSDCPFRVSKDGEAYAADLTCGENTGFKLKMDYGIVRFYYDNQEGGSFSACHSSDGYMGPAICTTKRGGRLILGTISNSDTVDSIIEINAGANPNGHTQDVVFQGSVSFATYRSYYGAESANCYFRYESPGIGTNRWLFGDTGVGAGSSYWSNYTLSVDGNGYMSGTLSQGSDLALKTDVKEIDEDSLLDHIEPVEYRYKADKDKKLHFGVTYQNICEALTASGIDPEESAMVSVAVDGRTGEETGAVAYSELIGLLIYEVKELKARITELERR